MKGDPRSGTLRLLEKYGIPVTGENYLLLAFAGEPPEEMDGELAAEMPSAAKNLDAIQGDEE